MESSVLGSTMPNQEPRKRTILLVDSEVLVRYALSQLINSFGNYEVVAEAENTDSALAALEEHRPDILLTEIALPGPSGLELLLEMQRRKMTGVKTLVLSQVTSANMVTQALLAGAQGYILKCGSPEELCEGLEVTLTNKRYLPPQIAHLASVPEGGYELGARSKPNDPLEPLSPREREIFHLLANGLQNTVIAQKLFISPRTVETHRARIVRKLGLNSNGELIRFAIKHGLTIV